MSSAPRCSGKWTSTTAGEASAGLHGDERVFDGDEIIVTAIGLTRSSRASSRKPTSRATTSAAGSNGPLGWEVPAGIGVKVGKPDHLVVGVVGDYSFQFLMEEVAVAVQYKIPYVLIMLNNGYMGLIRQSELHYDMNYAVDIAYEGPDNDYGIDNVMVMEAMGALGRRIWRPEEIRDALSWAVQASNERRVPALVEIMCEREVQRRDGPLDRQDQRVRAHPRWVRRWPARSSGVSRRGD